MNYNNKKGTDENPQKDLCRHFSKGDTQMTNRYKKCSTSLSRRMQVKTTMRLHLISIGVVSIKINVGEDVHPCAMLVGM